MIDPALFLILANLPSIILSLIAGTLAYKGIEGWGWFLFIAVLLAKSFNSPRKDDDDEDPPSANSIPTPPRSVIHRN